MGPNGLAVTSNGSDHGPDGRFVKGNVSARTHGLRASSRKELRRRNRRVSLRLASYQQLRAEQGRPIRASQLPLARRYCELDVLANDKFALVIADPSNEKALEQYLSIAGRLATLAATLGETAAATKELERFQPRDTPLRQIARAREEHERLLEAHQTPRDGA